MGANKLTLFGSGGAPIYMVAVGNIAPVNVTANVLCGYCYKNGTFKPLTFIGARQIDRYANNSKVAMSRDGRTLVAIVGNNIDVFKLTGETTYTRTTPESNPNTASLVTDLSLSPSGKTLFISEQGLIKFCYIDTNGQLGVYYQAYDTYTMDRGTLSADGRYCIAFTANNNQDVNNMMYVKYGTNEDSWPTASSGGTFTWYASNFDPVMGYEANLQAVVVDDKRGWVYSSRVAGDLSFSFHSRQAGPDYNYSTPPNNHNVRYTAANYNNNRFVASSVLSGFTNSIIVFGASGYLQYVNPDGSMDSAGLVNAASGIAWGQGAGRAPRALLGYNKMVVGVYPAESGYVSSFVILSVNTTTRGYVLVANSPVAWNINQFLYSGFAIGGKGI